MPPLTREQRVEIGRKSWEGVTDPAQRAARTAKARETRLRNLADKFDPERKLPPAQRAKLAEEARRELCRNGGLETQRRNRLNAEIARRAQELADQAPPLTAEQRVQLAAILRPHNP
ncbi:hypothetical protein GO011_14625 [Mycobacterium sp. 20091114027_K0903767]|nr:hypothetical protein [Mycobacterium sp. 20091114027_K0903767]